MHFNDVTLSTLRQMGISIMNYLNDWLLLARSEQKKKRANSSLSPSKQIVFLGTVFDLAQMRAWITLQHSLLIQRLAAFF